MIRYLLLILVILPFIGLAQTDRDLFQDVFDSEIDQSNSLLNRQNHSNLYQFTKPQTVPNWLLSPPPSNNSAIYAIGISDPGTDTTLAYKLAIERAKVIANFYRKTNIQLICDFFHNEKSNQNQVAYEHYSRLSTVIPSDNRHYIVVDSLINAFGEAIVLVKFVPPVAVNNEQLLFAQFDMYKNEIEHNTYGNFESVYELLVQNSNTSGQYKMFYQITEYGQRSDVESNIDTIKVTVPIYSLKYNNIAGPDSVEVRFFSHGLWKEYIKTIVTSMAKYAREKPENISLLAASKRSDTDDDKHQKLTRGKSENIIGFSLNSLSGFNNSITVNIVERQISY